jgi:hypothetical protein
MTNPAYLPKAKNNLGAFGIAVRPGIAAFQVRPQLTVAYGGLTPAQGTLNAMSALTVFYPVDSYGNAVGAPLVGYWNLNVNQPLAAQQLQMLTSATAFANYWTRDGRSFLGTGAPAAVNAALLSGANRQKVVLAADPAAAAGAAAGAGYYNGMQAGQVVLPLGGRGYLAGAPRLGDVTTTDPSGNTTTVPTGYGAGTLILGILGGLVAGIVGTVVFEEKAIRAGSRVATRVARKVSGKAYEVSRKAMKRANGEK